MYFSKTLGVLLLCSFAATELITFKPFVRSRYSVRERTRTTTKLPLLKSNDSSIDSNLEANIQMVSTANPGQNFQTTFETEIDKGNGAISTAAGPTIDVTPTSAVENERKQIKVDSQNTVTTKSPVTTTQSEWIYDYYASDDENPKRRN